MTITEGPRRRVTMGARGGGESGTKKTIIVFSGEMDRVLAAFVLAGTLAAAMEDEVTMFFTFWGLNVLRKWSIRRTRSISRFCRRRWAG